MSLPKDQATIFSWHRPLPSAAEIEGVCGMGIDFRISSEEFKAWGSQRINAFFSGIELIIRAVNDTLPPAAG